MWVVLYYLAVSFFVAILGVPLTTCVFTPNLAAASIGSGPVLTRTEEMRDEQIR